MPHRTAETPSAAGRGRTAVIAAVVAALSLGLVAAPAHAAADSVQRSLDGLVSTGEFPGALAAVRAADGAGRDYTAGVGDLTTKAEVPVDGRVRIASNTKMFTAVAVLQLAGEGRIDLDAPVERYLPGVVRGHGNDGRLITPRQLLQHTAGLPNYTRDMAPILTTRDRYREPRELLDTGLKHRRTFPPGKGWEYSNTGYVVAGLLVQKVTGRPIGEVVTGKVIRRAGLKDTYWPGVGERGIEGPHPKGYTPGKNGSPVDITNLDPSWGWAAGQLVGTPSDVNRFLVALMDGRLLKPAQLKAMKQTIEAPGFPAGWSYGLGLIKMKLSCGGYAYGHGGDIDGYDTRTAITEDGRAATVAVTALPTTEPAMLKVNAALDTALCTTP